MITTGLITGLIGYNLKKEFLGGALFYREVQTLEYEVISLSLSGWSPSAIHDNIKKEFVNYTGDVRVKVVEVPSSYYAPNDSIRSAKYNVSVELKSVPTTLGTQQPELADSYYKGLDYAFFTGYGSSLIDFKEDFTFETNDNGIKSFGHDVNFTLLSGTKAMATTIITSIFNNDKDTTFGIGTMVGGCVVADTGNFLDYFTEVYDEIRQNYRFNKKRELLPLSGANYLSTFNHSFNLKEDGICDVSERGQLKGKKSFDQAQQACETLISNSFSRCSGFYSTFKGIETGNLINLPTKITKDFNRPAISADYEVSFTNNPQFSDSGYSREEIFDFSVGEIGIVDLKHNLNYTLARRHTNTNFTNLFSVVTGYSNTACSGYYANSYYYKDNWPLNLIKRDVSWPSRKAQGSISFQYSNHPKYWITFNGVLFQYLDSKVQTSLPVDIVNEYKIINRPSQTSLINYSYQTEKGQVTTTVEAGIGRNSDEFTTNFRSDYSSQLVAAYQYGISSFLNQFKNVVPLSFTYFLSDLKYTMNQDAVLVMTLTFTYTLKKYQM